MDAQLADRIGSCGWRAIETAVAQAIATYDPHLLETREKHGRDAWGVRLFHRGVGTDGADDWVGTSHLEVTGDTLDLTTFHDLVCDQAAQLKALGDTDTLDIRKAKAVGVIANRQAALDLGTLLGPDDRSPAEPAHPVPPAAKTKLYLHLSLTDLLGLDGNDGATSDGSDGSGFGSVERFGPATIARIKDWAGRSRVTIQPVLDMTRTDAVDAHDPPAWMRELVILRDRHCVFPCAPGTPEPATSTTSPPMRRTVHPARPGPKGSRPSVEDTTARKLSGDGATTAPRPAATSGPDPKGRPTWSPRKARSPSRRTESRQVVPEEVAKQPSRRARPPTRQFNHRRSPGHQPGDPACPKPRAAALRTGAAGAGRRGVPRRRSVKAKRGGTPRSNRDGRGDGDASRRGEPSAADVVRRTAPNQPHHGAAQPRTNRTTTPHSPEPTAPRSL